MSSSPKPSPAVITELDMERLTAAIEDERRRRELTYQETANQLVVSASTLAYWRLGTTRPTGDALLRIALWLPCDLRDYVKQPAVLDPADAA
jgi:transcriptional regulator with XRE-family HTH domain